MHMQHSNVYNAALAVLLAISLGAASPAIRAQTPSLGTDLDGLLAYARQVNPEYASMRSEADAAAERVYPAGALPDPVLRTELQNITNAGTSARPNFFPSRIGSTRYLLMQSVPYLGKRDLKREVAQADTEQASARAAVTWAELTSKIKVAFAEYYYVANNLRLTAEILDLMTRLEQVAQVRYAGGLVAQQDAIRAQLEQTAMRTELVAMESERRQVQARLNALLARPNGAPLAEPASLRPMPPPARLDPETLQTRVRERNPLLFAEDARVRAAEKSRALTLRNRYPDFTFGVAPIQMGSRIGEWELMVEVNIPLQQETRRAQEREADAMLAAARARKDAAANQVLSDLAENLSGLDAARRTEALADGALLPQARLTFQSALAGYETGKVDFATLLDAQRQIRRAKQDGLKARVDGQMRLVEIERLVGEEL